MRTKAEKRYKWPKEFTEFEATVEQGCNERLVRLTEGKRQAESDLRLAHATIAKLVDLLTEGRQ
jgi:hypothetical protein